MTINDFINKIKEMNINISDIQLEQLEKYYEMLIDWNSRMNLTGITEKNEVYLKHFYDSLTISKIIDLNNVNSLCDIGTGAGFPGVVIKIVFPNINVTLVDSLNKRINFLDNVIKELNLKGIETISARAEEYSRNIREKYDVVTARAVALLPILLEYSVPLVKVNGYFISMKGDVSEELNNISNCMNKLGISLDSKVEFLLPVEDSKRTLLKFKKNSITNKRYPRRYSEMKKKSL